MVEFEMETPVTWLNESGVTEARSGHFGGGPGGGRRERPEGARPEMMQ